MIYNNKFFFKEKSPIIYKKDFNRSPTQKVFELEAKFNKMKNKIPSFSSISLTKRNENINLDEKENTLNISKSFRQSSKRENTAKETTFFSFKSKNFSKSTNTKANHDYVENLIKNSNKKFNLKRFFKSVEKFQKVKGKFITEILNQDFEKIYKISEKTNVDIKKARKSKFNTLDSRFIAGGSFTQPESLELNTKIYKKFAEKKLVNKYLMKKPTMRKFYNPKATNRSQRYRNRVKQAFLEIFFKGINDKKKPKYILDRVKKMLKRAGRDLAGMFDYFPRSVLQRIEKELNDDTLVYNKLKFESFLGFLRKKVDEAEENILNFDDDSEMSLDFGEKNEEDNPKYYIDMTKEIQDGFHVISEELKEKLEKFDKVVFDEKYHNAKITKVLIVELKMNNIDKVRQILERHPILIKFKDHVIFIKF